MSSAVSGVSRMTAWERWEMGTVEASLSPPLHGGTAASSPPHGMLAAHAARDTPGYAAGHVQGVAQGWAEGHDQGLKQGLEEGRARGLAQALAEGRASALAAAQQAQDESRAAVFAACAPLRALALSLPRAWQTAEQDMAQELLALAFTLAQQVLGQSLAVEPSGFLPSVRALLQAEPALSGHPKLQLHPEDAALMPPSLAEELHSAGWCLRHDPHIERGGCRVVATSGELDATLPTRWARVASRLALLTSAPEQPDTPLAPAPSHG